MASSKTLAPVLFKVRRCEPELVEPARPTPRELKPLSDVDDQIGLRFQIPIVQVYKSSPSMKGIDSVSLIRESLSKALVFYYPFAGRLRNLESSGKLAVDCTGEGVLFIEADADVTLSQLGELQAPFPCFDQLLYDVPGSGEITDCPVSLIQVTRFLCGGFILAMRHNHTMSDAPGLVQFITAIAEIARGATSPSVHPVWRRHLLNARDPPRVTCSHPEFDKPESSLSPPVEGQLAEDLSHRAFFFGAPEISTIRRSLPPHQRGSSTFDVVAAYLWRTRVVALELDPGEVLHGVVNVSVRSKMVNPSPLPEGFYGNSFAFAAARATAGDLAGKPLGHALELVRRAKESVTEEFMRSMVDLVVKQGRARFPATRPYIMSDIRYAGFGDVDFGWGKPVYGGVAGAIPGDAGFIVRCKNGRGEEGVSVAVCLPKQAMERFETHFDSLRLNSSDNNAFKSVGEYKLNIMSAL